MNTHDLICPECGGRFRPDTSGGLDTVMCPTCRRVRKITVYSLVSNCPYCGGELSIPVNRSPEERFCCPHCGKEFMPQTEILADPDSADAPAPRILEDGAIFEKYRIIRLLGRGGMAEVYLAEHLLLHRRCALKLMIERKNVVYQKRFLREARCVRDLSHPNIVRVFDAGCDDATGRLFIAMEYVEGTPLSEIADRKLPEADLLNVAGDMAKALEALEAIHVVHRDIKPSNIIRDKDGVFKLMDLGIAKTAHDEGDDQYTLTVERTIFGTPSYASPEQCRDSHRVDTRSDIYSLGATLYHLASGRCPYHGATAMETILKVLETDPEPLTKLRRDLSRPMQELIAKMLWKDPARRPQNAEELEKLVAEVRAGRWNGRSARSGFMKYMLAADILLLALLLLTFVIWKTAKRDKDAPAVKTAAAVEDTRSAPTPVRAPAEVRSMSDAELAAKNFETRMKVIRSRMKSIRPIDGFQPGIDAVLKKYKEVPDLSKWIKPPMPIFHIHLGEAFAAAARQRKPLLIFQASYRHLPGVVYSRDFVELADYFVPLFLNNDLEMLPDDQRRHNRDIFDAILRKGSRLPTSVTVLGPDGTFIWGARDMIGSESEVFLALIDDFVNGNELPPGFYADPRKAMFSASMRMVTNMYVQNIHARIIAREENIRAAVGELWQRRDQPPGDFASWRKPPSPGWNIHFGRAVGEAVREQKPMLVYFSAKGEAFPQLGSANIVDKFMGVMFFCASVSPDMPMSQREHLTELRRCFDVPATRGYVALIDRDGRYAMMIPDCALRGMNFMGAARMLLRSGGNARMLHQQRQLSRYQKIDRKRRDEFIGTMLRDFSSDAVASSWVRPNSPGWSSCVGAALLRGIAENKCVLIVRGASEPPFMRDREFIEFAEDLIPVFIRSDVTGMPESQIRHNKAVEKHFFTSAKYENDVENGMVMIDRNCDRRSTFSGKIDRPAHSVITMMKSSIEHLRRIDNDRSDQVKKLLENTASVADCASWLKPPEPHWRSHLAEALAEAKRDKKLVLILNRGTALSQDEVDTPEFFELCRREFVPLALLKGLPSEPEQQTEYCTELLRALSMYQGAAPAAFVVAADGRLVTAVPPAAFADPASRLRILKMTAEHRRGSSAVAVAGGNWRAGSIEERIGRAETRLRELRSELQCGGAPDVLNKKIRFRTEQLRRLKEQLAVRERARHLDRSKFDAARTKEFQRKIAELTSPHHNYGFPDELMDELKSGKIDPNVEVVDSAWAPNSGPLLKCIASGRTYKAAEVAQVLVAQGADTSCMVPNGNTMTSYGVWPIVLTQGGFDAMTGCLLPFLKLHPVPEKTVEDILYLNHRVDERDDSGNTALHCAARAGKLRIVSLLLLADADVNARNDLGETPLFGATKNNHDEICKLLVRAGADRKIRNNDGKTAEDMAVVGKFHDAVDNANLKKIAELLKEGVDPDTRFGNGYTALQTACLKRDRNMVNLLLDGGADPDLGRRSAEEGEGFRYYPLQIAFWRDSLSPEIFALLLKKDANPNIPPLRSGGTTLLLHLCRGHEKYSQRDEGILLDALLDSPRAEQYIWYSGYELSILSIALRNRRPLWFVGKIAAKMKVFKSPDPVLAEAVEGDYPEELIRELIARGANVNAVCHKSRAVMEEGSPKRFVQYTNTALSIAVENKRADIVRLLLEHGADKDWKNSEGKTVRDLDTTAEIRALLK